MRMKIIAMMTILTLVGCREKNENARLAEQAIEHQKRQAAQSHQIMNLQKEVAAGSRQLVDADASSRKETILLQRDMQLEQSRLNAQRDQLEIDRKAYASHLFYSGLIATSIQTVGLMVACLLPLVICWKLLMLATEQTEHELVGELILEDLSNETPMLVTYQNQPLQKTEKLS